MSSFDVGGIFASLGFAYDDRGADQFERRYTELEHKPDIKTHAALDVDQRGFNSYNRQLATADEGHKQFLRGTGRLRTALGILTVGGGAFGAAAIGAGLLAKGLHGAVSAFEDAEVVGRRQNLVIRTMGQDAGATAEHVDKLAAAQGRKAGLDDDLIISGANVIRTFKNIRNEAGAGNDIFDRTTKAAVDLSAAFGTDLQSAAIQLGKALDDPARGAAALSRTGAIAKADVDALKKAAEDGVPKLELQRRVLQAVEKQVKGTAAESATGTMKMSAAWGNLLEVIGAKVAPVFNKVAGYLTDLFEQAQHGEGPLVDIWNRIVAIGKGALAAGKLIVTGLRPAWFVIREVAGTVADLWRAFQDGNGVVRAITGAILGAAAAFAALKVIFGIRSAVIGLATALRTGLAVALAAISANPLIAVGVAVAALVGALIGLASRQRTAAERADEHRAALDKLRDAMRRTRDAELGVAESRQQARSAGLAVEESEKALEQARKQHGKGSLEARRAEEDLRAARLGSKRANFEVKRSEDELRDARKNAGKASDDEEKKRDTANAKINDEINQRRDLIAGYQSHIDAIKEQGKQTDITRAQIESWRRAIKVAKDDLSDLEHTQRKVNRAVEDTPLDRASRKVDQARKAYREARTELDRYEKGTGKYRDAAKRAEHAEDNLKDALDRKRQATKDAVAPLVTLIGNVQGLGLTVASVSDSVGGNVNEVLKQLGAKAIAFTIHHPGKVAAGVGAGAGTIVANLFARGGIPNPGSGHHDDHLLIAPDGRPVAAMSGTEGILNTPQMGEVDQQLRITHALGLGRFNGLGALWGAGMRHFAGGGRLGRFLLEGPAGALRDEGQGAADVEVAAANKLIGRKQREAAAAAASAGSTHGLVAQVLRALAYAREHGWSGVVTSGLRSISEQQYLWDNSAALGLVRGISVAAPGTSNHERGRAVDVTLWQQFLRIMQGAPAAAKLLWRGPTDPVHFSVDGHAGGGLLARFAGGGKMTKKERRQRQHTAESKAHTQAGRFITHGEQRALARLGRRTGINGFDQAIADLERTYGQKERAYGLSDEDLIIENEDGSTTVDAAAQKHREDELNDLITRRSKIGDKIVAYREAIKKMVAAYRRAIARLERALRRAAGRGRGEERSGYRDLIRDYRGRIGELKQTAHDLGFDLKDNAIDITELQGELGDVTGTTGTPAPADSSDAATGTSVADQVAAEFAAFQAGRQDLFANFGSNFMRPGEAPTTPTQQAAGYSYWGAGGGTQMPGPANLPVGSDAIAAAREGGIHITVNGQELGDNPLHWTAGIKDELAAA